MKKGEIIWAISKLEGQPKRKIYFCFRKTPVLLHSLTSFDYSLQIIKYLIISASHTDSSDNNPIIQFPNHSTFTFVDHQIIQFFLLCNFVLDTFGKGNSSLHIDQLGQTYQKIEICILCIYWLVLVPFQIFFQISSFCSLLVFSWKFCSFQISELVRF